MNHCSVLFLHYVQLVFSTRTCLKPERVFLNLKKKKGGVAPVIYAKSSASPSVTLQL